MKEDVITTLLEIIIRLNVNFIHQKETSIEVFYIIILKKWKTYRNGFGILKLLTSEDKLFNKKISKLCYFTYWQVGINSLE